MKTVKPYAQPDSKVSESGVQNKGKRGPKCSAVRLGRPYTNGVQNVQNVWENRKTLCSTGL